MWGCSWGLQGSVPDAYLAKQVVLRLAAEILHDMCYGLVSIDL